MQAGCWIALFRRVPATQHDNLMVVTTNGTEIMVQRIVRLEDDFAIVRGRLSGSTDQGRVMMIPYDQMSYLAFNKALLEKEIQAIFGAPAGDGEFAQIAKIQAEPDHLTDEAAEPEEVEEEEAPAAETAAKPKPPSKSILLARLRERLAGGER